MKKRIATVAAVALMGFAFAAQAADSGCGLGAVIIQRNSKILQLLSLTTNSYFLTQPLGITSGTSGCSASGIVMNDRAIEYFAQANQADLARQIAQGGGEKVQTLASLHGCSAKGQKAFAEIAQKSLARMMPTPETSARDMLVVLQGELRADPRASTECELLAAR
jgi:hypothetical protein